jgi:protocatechuate 3,4-dioxygenase beta subunit
MSSANPNHSNHHEDAAHDDHHDLGLSYDLTRWHSADVSLVSAQTNPLLDRRNLLKYVFIAGTAGFMAFGFKRNASAQTTTANGSCVDISEETAGPYPGDGTNGPNILTASGVVRSDITPSFHGQTGRAAGVPLTLTLTINDAATCAPARGYAVYLWHADQQGRYSMYSAGVTDQNYLRGVQETDANGTVTFKTIFPGCYDGRWPHMHFEVYPSLAAAGDATKRIATSQLAFPKATCEQAYASTGYSASPGNLARVSLASDGVFGDDSGARQVAAMTGTVANGLNAALNVTVSNTVKASAGGGPGQGGPGGPPPGSQTRTAPPGQTIAPNTAVAPTTTVAPTVTTNKPTATTKKRTTRRPTTTTKKRK